MEHGKRLVLLFLIALTSLPILILLPFDNNGGLWGYLASASGYIGLSLITWQAIIGNRSVIGMYFEDLNWTNKISSLAETCGLLLILVHPITLIKYLNYSWLYILKPDFSGTSETYTSLGRIGLLLLVIIWITSVLLRKLIHYRLWRRINLLIYPAAVLAAVHAWGNGLSHNKYFGASLILWVLLAMLIISLLIKLKFALGFGKSKYTVESNKQIAEGSFMLKLTPKSGRHLRNRPGQYLYLQLHTFGEQHPFTILNHDTVSDSLYLGFKVFGKFSDKMSKLKPGRVVKVDGAYGTFTKNIPPPDKTAIFMAGGIGITPFVRYILDPERTSDLLFYSYKNPSHAPLLDLIRQSIPERVVDIVSAPENGEGERISREKVLSYIDQPSAYEYFICGPPDYIDHCIKILKNLGVSRQQINVEHFFF